MCRALRVSAVWAVLALVAPARPPEAQPTVPAPAISEVRSSWASFWARVAEGDLEAARPYLHSSIRGSFPGMRPRAEWHEVALQMAFCRIDQTPVPISGQEIAHAVHCAHGGETAETLTILRRDGDGAWRFTSP